MKGHVRKRGKTWSYTFEIGKLDGKRKQKSKGGFRTKSEAQDALRKALNDFDNGYVEQTQETFGEYLMDWLEQVKIDNKINTYYRYRGVINEHVKRTLGGIKLIELKPIHIDNLLREKKKAGLSGSTLQLIYTIINTPLNRAEKLRLINNNPCRYVDRPKRQKFKANVLSIEEVQSIFSHLNNGKYYDYIMYIALSIELELGLRRGELAGLQYENVDFENNVINIEDNLIYSNGQVFLVTPKTDDSTRSLYVSNDLMKLIKKHKSIQAENKLRYGKNYVKNKFNDEYKNFVLTWENGKNVHPNYLTNKFKKILKACKLNDAVRFHDLRHTNATLLLQNDIDFKVIQERLGHSIISTTMDLYAHVNIDMQKPATQKLSKMLAKK